MLLKRFSRVLPRLYQPPLTMGSQRNRLNCIIKNTFATNVNCFGGDDYFFAKFSEGNNNVGVV